VADIKAIETQYKGYRFRSRLEARWAVFFDALGIEWEYEREGYDLGDAGWYLPDFWIEKIQCAGGDPRSFHVEIKPKRELEREETEKILWLAKLSKVDVIVCFGDPADENTHCTAWTDDDNYWVGRVRFAYIGNIPAIIHEFEDINWRRMLGQLYAQMPQNRERVENAFLKARSARFEFGEQG